MTNGNNSPSHRLAFQFKAHFCSVPILDTYLPHTVALEEVDNKLSTTSYLAYPGNN